MLKHFNAKTVDISVYTHAILSHVYHAMTHTRQDITNEKLEGKKY